MSIRAPAAYVPTLPPSACPQPAALLSFICGALTVSGRQQSPLYCICSGIHSRLLKQGRVSVYFQGPELVFVCVTEQYVPGITGDVANVTTFFSSPPFS